jgi:hypothetical protein
VTYTYTLTLSDGTRVEVVSTRTPQQRARYEHLCRLFGCWDVPADDSMTAQDWQQVQTAAAERAQRADDAALYNTGRDGSDRGVGY